MTNPKAIIIFANLFFCKYLSVLAYGTHIVYIYMTFAQTYTCAYRYTYTH